MISRGVIVGLIGVIAAIRARGGFEQWGPGVPRPPAIPLPVLDALLDEVGVARLGNRQVAERLVDRVEDVLG